MPVQATAKICSEQENRRICKNESDLEPPVGQHTADRLDWTFQSRRKMGQIRNHRLTAHSKSPLTGRTIHKAVPGEVCTAVSTVIWVCWTLPRRRGGWGLDATWVSLWWVWPISPVWLHWAAPDWDHNTDSRHDPCRRTMHWLIDIRERYGALKLKSVPSRRIDGFVKMSQMA